MIARASVCCFSDRVSNRRLLVPKMALTTTALSISGRRLTSLAVASLTLKNHHESERPRYPLRLHLGLSYIIPGLVEEADTQSHQRGVSIDGLRGYLVRI